MAGNSAYKAQWVKDHPEKNREYARKARLKAKNKVYDHYGCVCSCCGETNEKFLTIDHIDDSGADHKRAISKEPNPGSYPMYLDIIKKGFPDNIRIYCYNCNCGRARNGGVCPHLEEAPAVPLG